MLSLVSVVQLSMKKVFYKTLSGVKGKVKLLAEIYIMQMLSIIVMQR